jgi:hypothetical protein
LQISEILENEKCEIVNLDGGTEAGITFYEFLIKGNYEHCISVTGQLHGDTFPQQISINTLAIYSGSNISEDKLFFEWFSGGINREHR